MIMSVLNQKGGVGKTTLSIHIAGELVYSTGNRVLVVDADKQGSALDWVSNRDETLPSLFNVIGLPKPILHKEISSIAKDYDHIIIDGPPRVNDVATSAISASDIVIIPVQPSPYDVMATEEIIKLINQVSAFKDNIKCYFVINRKIVNTAIGRDVVEELKKYPFPVLNTAVHNRVIFGESGVGKLVREIDRNSSAAKEITHLVTEIMEW